MSPSLKVFHKQRLTRPETPPVPISCLKLKLAVEDHDKLTTWRRVPPGLSNIRRKRYKRESRGRDRRRDEHRRRIIGVRHFRLNNLRILKARTATSIVGDLDVSHPSSLAKSRPIEPRDHQVRRLGIVADPNGTTLRSSAPTGRGRFVTSRTGSNPSLRGHVLAAAARVCRRFHPASRLFDALRSLTLLYARMLYYTIV